MQKDYQRTSRRAFWQDYLVQGSAPSNGRQGMAENRMSRPLPGTGPYAPSRDVGAVTMTSELASQGPQECGQSKYYDGNRCIRTRAYPQFVMKYCCRAPAPPPPRQQPEHDRLPFPTSAHNGQGRIVRITGKAHGGQGRSHGPTRVIWRHPNTGKAATSRGGAQPWPDARHMAPEETTKPHAPQGHANVPSVPSVHCPSGPGRLAVPNETGTVVFEM